MLMDRADITGSSAKHMGLALRALSDANVSRVTIQSRTYGEVRLSLIWTTWASASPGAVRRRASPH